MNIRELPIEDVFPNPDQPRKVFGSIEELAASIESSGLLQPIRVRAQGRRFMIILGERRYRAHKLLGRKTIAAIVVVDMSDDALADAAIVENMQRKDISPLEEAKAYQARLETGLTIEELAKRLGIRQPWRITERTALLRLDGQMQIALAAGIITPSQGQEMSRLSHANQKRLFDAIGAGKCRSYAELRHVTQALLDDENQTDMFPADRKPTNEERETLSALKRQVETLSALLMKSFDASDVAALRRINPLEADVLVEKLEVAEKQVRRIRLELAASRINAA